MISDLPEYFTTESLAAFVKVSRRVLFKHIALNVGNIQAAKEKHKGVGVRYSAKGARKYIAIVTAGKEVRKQEVAA